VHQDPVTKSQRLTNSAGTVVSTIDLDPWGGETGRSDLQSQQPHRYTTYERDKNGGDEAMFRRYESGRVRFSQPDPYDGSYDLADPQSLNRYAYVQNDPVNFTDPSGLLPCIPGNYSAECGMNGFGGWGGGFSGGNGWSDDPRPGEWIIDEASNRTWPSGWSERGISYSIFEGYSPWTGFSSGTRTVGDQASGPQEDKPVEDPCNGSTNWPTKLADMRRIGDIAGFDIDNGGNDHPRDNLTLTKVVSNLVGKGFKTFPSARHPNGVNLEGTVDGRWYHVIVFPQGGYWNFNSAPNNLRNSLKSPASGINIHCEWHYFKPYSWEHFMDFPVIH
jgi:RHS repeat-associated protein